MSDQTVHQETSCIVCGGVSERVVWRENGYEGRACVCETVYVTPEPPKVAVDQTVDLHPESFYALPAPLKVEWLRRRRPAGRLLEVGCGEGHFLAAAKKAGYEVAGLEPDPARAQRVANGLGIPVQCAFLDDACGLEGQFDVIYHSDMLSHFIDPVSALQKMSTFLRPGGILAFEVGLLGGIAPFWFRQIGAIGFPQHRWLYSESSLHTLIARAGLHISDTKHFGLAPYLLLQGCVRLLIRVARFLGLMNEKRNGQPVSTQVLKLPVSERQQRFPLYERAQNFVRYRVGAFSPHLGPGTLFVVAHL